MFNLLINNEKKFFCIITTDVKIFYPVYNLILRVHPFFIICMKKKTWAYEIRFKMDPR